MICLNVGAKPKLNHELINDGEGLTQFLASTRKFHQHTQCAVGWSDMVFPHLLHPEKGSRKAVFLGAAIEQAVVHHLIGHEFAISSHLRDAQKPLASVEYG